MSEMWRGRYGSVETIAQGGQGRLLRGIDRQHDRPVALKVRNVASIEERNQVLAEARVLLSLQPHPGLPTVREDFFEGDSYVLVMDWVDGTSLDQVVAARGAPGMPLPSVLRWATQLAAAIDHLHAHRPVIVHGDVKPANAVLTPDDRVVLVDFGIATNGVVTRSGTIGYAAPEVLDGQAPTAAADIYGLAATLLALLTGRPPGDVRPPWDGLDPITIEVIERGLRPGLALEPDRRPASARELVERMRSWAGPAAAVVEPSSVRHVGGAADTHVPKQSSAPRWWRRPAFLPAWVRVSFVAVVVAAIVVGFAFGSKPRSPVRRVQGPDRYSTAAQVALNSFTHADTAVLARGDDLSDAIAGSYLAGSQGGGPILLTPPGGLPDDVLSALAHLKVKQVFIIGDNTAISGSVDTALQAKGMRTTRLAGVTRYATAGVIEQAGGPAAKLAGYGPTALLVSSTDMPDAVAVGPISFHNRFPLLYTAGTEIPAETVAALREGGITHVVLVGPVSQIGDAIVTQLSALDITAERLAGAGDPTSESIALASFELERLHWPLPQIDLVRGDQGAVDGVATIANAGSNASALMLTNSPSDLGPALTSFLTQHNGRVQQLIVVGDLTTITPSVEQAAATALHLSE